MARASSAIFAHLSVTVGLRILVEMWQVVSGSHKLHRCDPAWRPAG